MGHLSCFSRLVFSHQSGSVIPAKWLPNLWPWQSSVSRISEPYKESEGIQNYVDLITDFFFCSYLDVQFSALNFPKDSREGFARVNMTFTALSSVSVCVRVQWDTEWNEVSTIFSYAAPVFTNEFQLRGQVDMRERILLALIIRGKHLPYKASFPNDGAWHHICVTWRSSSGHWTIYVDGNKKDTGSSTDTSRDIHGDGIFILGQDQDSFGGNFTEPFFGAITDLNIWSMSLEMRHVSAFNACSPVTQEALFSWNLDQLSRHPVVKEVQAQLFCPGKITLCACQLLFQ